LAGGQGALVPPPKKPVPFACATVSDASTVGAVGEPVQAAAVRARSRAAVMRSVFMRASGEVDE
jgi:hypothetical protein